MDRGAYSFDRREEQVQEGRASGHRQEAERRSGTVYKGPNCTRDDVRQTVCSNEAVDKPQSWRWYFHQDR